VIIIYVRPMLLVSLLWLLSSALEEIWSYLFKAISVTVHHPRIWHLILWSSTRSTNFKMKWLLIAIKATQNFSDHQPGSSSAILLCICTDVHVKTLAQPLNTYYPVIQYTIGIHQSDEPPPIYGLKYTSLPLRLHLQHRSSAPDGGQTSIEVA